MLHHLSAVLYPSHSALHGMCNAVWDESKMADKMLSVITNASNRNTVKLVLSGPNIKGTPSIKWTKKCSSHINHKINMHSADNIKPFYYMASSLSGQDEPNRTL